MTGIPKFLTPALLLCFLFCTCAPSPNDDVVAASEIAAAANPKIVFVRLDSLQNGYTELVTELERLQDNAQAADENIQKKLASLQQEAARLQNKIQRGEMTPKMIQNEEQRFQRKQQEIAQQRDIALAAIQEDQLRLNQQFGERVKEILEQIQEEKGYDYILNEGGGSGVLLGRDEYDITADVLAKLNAMPPINAADAEEDDATEE